MPLQLRRGTDAQRQSMSEPLAAGELIYVTDTGTIYVGNGTTVGGVPVINITAADIKPLAAQIFTAGSHTGISFTYNSGSQTIDAVVNPDLSNYQGVIVADAFQGSVFAEDSTQLVNAIDGSINLDGTVKSNIIPDQDAVYDIGSPSAKFGDLYLSGSSLYLGDAVITSTGTAVNLPLGSTIGGIIIGSGDGVVAGSNYNINIVGEDSTTLVDAQSGTITAPNGFIGDLKGTVVGDDSTILVDGVTGFLRGILTGNVQSVDSAATMVDTTNKSFTTGRLYFERNNITTLSDEEIILRAPRYRFDVTPSATTGNELITGLDNVQYLELYSTPESGNIAVGDITSLIAFSPVDESGREFGQVFVGAQVDPNATFTSTWSSQKFFVMVFPDTEPTDPVNPEDFRYLTFDSRGWLSINKETPEATLDINGFAKLAVLETAPSTPANGMVAVASGNQGGGEWDPLSAGAKQQMVVYLGGGWREIAIEP